MKASVSNNIIIENPTSEVIAYCKHMLSFANPEFIKKQAMGKWTGNIKRDIVLYSKMGNSLVLPFGCLQHVFENKAQYSEITPQFAPHGTIDYLSDILLYDYQERAVGQAVRCKNGVLVAPCGSGKTQMALEVVARIGKPTLWLTHTQDLLNQSMSRAKSCLSIDLGTYGTITAGKVNIGTGITFATVQTMCNIELAQYKNYWGCIIVDECHKVCGSPTNLMMFYKVISSLSARYKVGVTATPKRADGLERSMFTILGDLIYEVPRSAVKDKTCDVVVCKRLTSYTPNLDVILAGDGTLVYSSLIEDIIRNDERNTQIVEDICKIDGYCLVLTDRLEHIETLCKMINNKVGKGSAVAVTGVSCSKKAKAERKEVFTKLNCGEVKYVIATYKLAKEGLDIPQLRYIIMATPQKDETTVIQACGRVGRKAEGKDKGIVYDYVDNFGMLMGYSKKRNKYYKNVGYLLDIKC